MAWECHQHDSARQSMWSVSSSHRQLVIWLVSLGVSPTSCPHTVLYNNISIFVAFVIWSLVLLMCKFLAFYGQAKWSFNLVKINDYMAIHDCELWEVWWLLFVSWSISDATGYICCGKLDRVWCELLLSSLELLILPGLILIEFIESKRALHFLLCSCRIQIEFKMKLNQ